jgi:hypothetical protein
MLIDKAAAADFLRSSIPDWTWFISKVESDNGRFCFPPLVSRAIANLKIESYPLLYENEASIGLILFRAFMSQEEMLELNSQLVDQSPLERGQTMREWMSDLLECDEAFELPKTPAAEKLALAQFNALSKEDQAEAVRVGQHLWMGFLACFFQNVSVMVHGEKLTSLVAQAKAGSDDAFCKAVQIDKRILTTIPYFKQRFERGTLEGDQDFTDALAYRLQCPPYKGKIRHKALWMTFAYLDMVGLLDNLTHQEILDLCDDAGVGGYPNRIEDVRHISKRLADFRRFRGYGLTVSTP